MLAVTRPSRAGGQYCCRKLPMITLPTTRPPGDQHRADQVAGQPRPPPGERDEQARQPVAQGGQDQRAGGAERPGQPGGEQGAEQAADVPGRDQQADRGGAEADHADQEDDDQGQVPGVGEVGRRRVDGERTQVGVAGHERDARPDPGAPGAVAGGGATGRMRSRQAAETTKLAALNSSAVAAPSAWAARPAAARPLIAATDAPPCSLALPSTSSAGLTRDGR